MASCRALARSSCACCRRAASPGLALTDCGDLLQGRAESGCGNGRPGSARRLRDESSPGAKITPSRRACCTFWRASTSWPRRSSSRASATSAIAFAHRRGDRARGDRARGDRARGDRARGDRARGDRARGDRSDRLAALGGDVRDGGVWLLGRLRAAGEHRRALGAVFVVSALLISASSAAGDRRSRTGCRGRVAPGRARPSSWRRRSRPGRTACGPRRISLTDSSRLWLVRARLDLARGADRANIRTGPSGHSCTLAARLHLCSASSSLCCCEQGPAFLDQRPHGSSTVLGRSCSWRPRRPSGSHPAGAGRGRSSAGSSIHPHVTDAEGDQFRAVSRSPAASRLVAVGEQLARTVFGSASPQPPSSPWATSAAQSVATGPAAAAGPMAAAAVAASRPAPVSAPWAVAPVVRTAPALLR